MSFFSKLFKGTDKDGVEAEAGVVDGEAVEGDDAGAQTTQQTAAETDEPPDLATASGVRPAPPLPTPKPPAPTTPTGAAAKPVHSDRPLARRPPPAAKPPQKPNGRAATPAKPAVPARATKASGKRDGAVASPLVGMESSEVRAALDDSFDNLEAVDSSGAGGTSTQEDKRTVRELFEEMAAEYMVQVRSFMLEVTWSEAQTVWIGRCEPSIRSLLRMSETIEFSELTDALKELSSALTRARSSGGVLEGERKDAVVASYQKLVELVPRVFDLEVERSQREPIIVESLLKQTAGVRRLTVDRLYAAGLNRVDAFCRAKAEDLASLADIDAELAGAIAETFADYRKKSGSALAAADPANETRTLKAAVRELEKAHSAFEKSAASWTKSALEQKKSDREAREQVFQKTRVSLARLGAIELLRELERQSFQNRLTALRAYLASNANKNSSTPRKNGASNDLHA